MRSLRSANLFFFLLPVLFLQAQTPSVHVIQREFIFDTASFESCHASTIVSLNKDLLMSAWFGGKFEGNNDVRIWGSFFRNNTWSKPVLLAEGVSENNTPYPCWNPVLFKARNGLLYLHYKVGPNPREWWALYKTSHDDGKTWSKATRLPEGFLGPIKNKPVQLASGDILYPSSTESRDGTWNVQVEISDASLQQWKKIPVASNGFGVIQPTFLTYGKRMQMLCRSKQNVIAQSWSDDNGQSWSLFTSTALANPSSGIDAVTLQNGTQLLVYNPMPSGKEWWEGRAVLKIALSKDGINWNNVYTLEEHTDDEYSYPAVIQDASGRIHITYTSKRKRINYVSLDLR
ncbi:MAG: sialidase family protein [Sediminibacterium sp.]